MAGGCWQARRAGGIVLVLIGQEHTANLSAGTYQSSVAKVTGTGERSKMAQSA